MVPGNVRLVIRKLMPKKRRPATGKTGRAVMDRLVGWILPVFIVILIGRSFVKPATELRSPVIIPSVGKTAAMGWRLPTTGGCVPIVMMPDTVSTAIAVRSRFPTGGQTGCPTVPKMAMVKKPGGISAVAMFAMKPDSVWNATATLFCVKSKV